MAEGKKNNKDSALFWRAMVALLVFAVALLVPTETVVRAVSAERQMTAGLLGEEQEARLYETAVGLESHTLNINEIGSATESGLMGSNTKLSGWLDSRVEMLKSWGHLVAYRVAAIFSWVMLCLPFIAATVIDGFYTREGRKYLFVAQSPWRHMKAAQLFGGAIFLIPFSIFIPIALPPVLTPILMILAAVALWLMLINMQKRI